MKAERRHELRTNTLAQFLNDLPLYVKFHANKFLIGIILLCMVILLVRYRTNAAREAQESIRNSLDSARLGVEQLKMADRTQATDIARIAERKRLATQVNDSIESVLESSSESDDPAMRARALVLKGDLYWALANLPPIPGAATQPSLQMPQSPADYLSTAQSAYQDVLSKYDAEKVSKAAALFGLAAIEENRGNWDKAVAYYNSITSDQQMASVFKNLAQQRTNIVPQLKTPVFIGSFSSTQPTTAEASATQPATMQVVTMPATAPATTQPNSQ